MISNPINPMRWTKPSWLEDHKDPWKTRSRSWRKRVKRKANSKAARRVKRAMAKKSRRINR